MAAGQTPRLRRSPSNPLATAVLVRGLVPDTDIVDVDIAGDRVRAIRAGNGAAWIPSSPPFDIEVPGVLRATAQRTTHARDGRVRLFWIRAGDSTPFYADAADTPTRSKLGVFVLGSSTDRATLALLGTCPAVVKWIRGVGSDMLPGFREMCPHSTIVVRPWVPREAMGYVETDDPRARARDYAVAMQAGLAGLDPRDVDWVEGPNELDGLFAWTSSHAGGAWFAAFWDELADRIHTAGFAPLVGSLAVGNPPLLGDLGVGEPSPFLPTARVITKKPYRIGWSYHAYSPALDRDAQARERWYSLRFRLIRSELGLEGVPCVLTEGGQDAPGGWRSQDVDEERYLGWLKWFDAEIATDDDVEGVTLFQIGNRTDWASFDITPIAPELAAHIERERRAAR